jgi:hypothetical protein
MHQPFDAVVKPGPGANEPSGKAAIEKVKKGWDELRFVRVKEGRYLRYRVTFDTTHGDLVLDFFEGFAPDVVRNFVARAYAKLYDGLPLSLEDSSLVFGAPEDKQAYTLPARTIPAPTPKAALFAFVSGDRSTGERFGIALKRVSGGGKYVTMFGRVNNASTEEVLGQFAAEIKKKPGSVVVKSTRVQVFDQAIFEGAGVRLPELGKKGELIVPDLAMFTNVAIPDPDLGPRPTDMGGLKTRKPLPESMLNPIPGSDDTIRSKNPNAPPLKNENEAPKTEKGPPKKS